MTVVLEVAEQAGLALDLADDGHPDADFPDHTFEDDDPAFEAALAYAGMTALCDNRKCGADAVRKVRAEGLPVVKRICADDDCVFWVRAWFDVMHPRAGGHGLNYEPIGVSA